MARRGSLVGDAYVRIHADSSAVDRELRREMKAASKKGSDELIANWDEAIKARAKQRKWQARSALLDGIVGGKKDWDAQFKKSGLASVDDFSKAVEAQMRRIAKNGKSFKLLPQSLADFEEWAKGAKSEEALRKMQQAVVDQDKAWRSYSENITAAKKKQDEIERSIRKSEKALLDQDRAFNTYLDNVDPVRRMTKAMKEQEKAFASYSKNINAAMDFNPDTALSAQMRKAARQANEELIKGIVGGKAEWDRQFKKSGLSSVRDFRKQIRRELKDMGDAAAAAGRPFRGLNDALRQIDRWARGNSGTRIDNFARSIRRSHAPLQRFADLIGKAFGKGSRNNFFNFVGTVAGGIARIGAAIGGVGLDAFSIGIQTLGAVGQGAFDFFKGMKQLLTGGGAGGLIDGLKDFGSSMGDIAKTIGGALLTGLKAIVPLLIAVGAAVSIATIAIPPLLALIGNLAAIVTAVAGTISIGLIGGLLALTPVAAALAGGIGTLIVLMMGFKDETKKVKKAIKPLADAWSDLKKKLQGPVLEKVAKAFASFAPLIKNFVGPLMLSFANGITKIAQHMADVFNSKQMKPFLDIWRTELPYIFENIGHAVATFSAALVAFFTPILPYAQKFADFLMMASQNFLLWTQSAEGQNAIADFMKTAWDRAKDLWDILVLVGEALGALFTVGDEEAGGTIIDAIKRKMEEFVKWLQEGNGTNLRDWFQNGLDTAKQLWQAVTDIAEALKTVNWQEASDNINTVIDVIGKMTAGILLVTSAWNVWTEGMGLGWQQAGSVFVAVYNGFIGPVMDKLLGAIAATIRALALLVGAIGNIPGFEWAKVASDKMYAAADGADALAAELRSIPDVNVNVNVGLSGPGAKLLQNKMMGRTTRSGQVLFAAGGILNGATQIRPNVIAGEAGREAIVPLDRPLSQVDPSVRALAAVAQGMTSLKSGGVVGGSGTTIEAGAIVVQAPYADPALVAESVFDHLAAAAR